MSKTPVSHITTETVGSVRIKKKRPTGAFTYSTERPQREVSQVCAPEMEPPEYKVESLAGMDKEKLKV